MWFYICRPCRGGASGWIAMAKRSPFVTDGDALKEPGGLLFDFGDTQAEAMTALLNCSELSP